MSDKKNILGMNMLEWKSLAGLQDPYSLELAQLSAEIGVPDVVQSGELTEARRRATSPSGKRLEIMKHLDRSRRAGKAPDPRKVQAYEKGMKGVTAKAANEGVTRDEVWEALLFDHGLTMRQFDGLLDEAMSFGDTELVDELLALEDRLDEIAGALGAIGGGLAKAGKAVGGVAMKGAKAVGSTALKVGKAGVKGIKKGYEIGKGVSDAAGAAKQAAGAAGGVGDGAAGGEPPKPGTPPAGNGGAGNPAVPPASNGAAAKSAAPAAAATPADPATAAPKTPGEGPAAAPAAAPTPGGGTGQPGAQKKPGLLKNLAGLAKGAAKVVGGSAGMVTNTATGGLKGAGKVAKGVKAGVKESFGEWLEQRGVTLEQYSALIDYAMENDDVEEMDSLLALEDLYNEGVRELLGLKPKKSKVASPEMWKKAKAVRDQHGATATKDASVRGRQVGQKKAAGSGTTLNTALEQFYHLCGQPRLEEG